MVNSAVIASLQAQPVPADQECRIESLSQILEGVEQYVRVTGLASTLSAGNGTTSPITNNSLQQLTNRIVTAEERISDLEETNKERRVAAKRVALNSGSSVVPLSWSPQMPTTDYEVRVSVYGPSDPPGDGFGYRIVAGSQTETGVTLTFTGIPANSSFTCVVEEL